MSEELNISDQALSLLETAGSFIQEYVFAMMNDVVREVSGNDDFVKGVIMAAAFILLIRQVYIHMRTGQQLSKEALVSGIRESTDEVVEDITRMTNEVKEKIGMKLRNSKVLPSPEQEKE